MDKIFFSIITPTYNRLESGYLESNIDSVQKQEPGSFRYEHIIIDDGSEDGTKKFIEELAKKDERVIPHHQENTGVVKATRKGLELAKGNYIIILDDDDLLALDSLKNRAEYIKENPKKDWFYGHAEWIDDFGLPTQPRFRSKYYSDHLYERMLINNIVHAGTPTVKKEAFDKVVWPEWLQRSQDYFLWLELMRPEHRLKAGFLNKILVKYRYHSQSYTSAIDNDLDKDEKKRKKEELNFKVRSLHPDSIYFLAKEAYIWLQEAHKTSDYWKKENQYLKNQLKFNEELVKTYRSSRVIGRIIRLGNVYRRIRPRVARITRRIKLKFVRIAKKLAFQDSFKRTKSIKNQKWDDDKPLVSIITPFYRRSDTMPDTIRSVLNQTFQNFEYIIVDDGSADEVSKQYLSKIKHPKIEIIEQDGNRGVAQARNTGINNARGKYVLCLDSDDLLDATYLEKAVNVLESDPMVSIVTFDTKMFGARDEFYLYKDYDPHRIIKENMIITAAVFRREAWVESGGYKDKIGYEDWEFWVNLSKNGYFAKHISEPIFNYRTADASRYIADLEKHNEHARHIQATHKDFKKRVRKHVTDSSLIKLSYTDSSVAINLNTPSDYRSFSKNNPNILIAVPWMTFGGAETLILNYTREIKDKFNLSFVTGLKAEHEWEEKFKEITPYIYHLANMFDRQSLYLEFISNYIATRNVEVLHIIHCGYVFKMLPELKKRHPKLRVAVTMFNDFVPYFAQSLKFDRHVDVFSTDNHKVETHYRKILSEEAKISVIPNGIDTDVLFNPKKYNQREERNNLKISQNEIAVFYVGRLSEEKNPDVFLEVASKIQTAKISDVKFFMIGNGPMRRELEKTIRTENLKNVNFLGYQSDIARYLSAADIFVLPSSVEGFPLSILEAMAMDTAVVASDVGAVADIIDEDETGNIVPPGSVDDIVEVIMNLNKDRLKLRRIQSNARREVAEKYSSKALGDRYQRLYERLLK